MARPRLSEEFVHYRRTRQCPQGHGKSLHFVPGSGAEVTDLTLRTRMMLDNPFGRADDHVRRSRAYSGFQRWTENVVGAVSIPQFRLDSELGCRECRTSWPVFTRPTEIAVHELGRTTTFLSSESRKTTNQGNSLTRKRLTFEEEWSTRLDVGWKHAQLEERAVSGGVKAKVHGNEVSAGLQRRLQENFEETAGISLATRRLARQEIEVDIPPYTTTEVTIRWKQEWQEFRCDIHFMDDGSLLSVPYRIAVNVTCDCDVANL